MTYLAELSDLAGAHSVALADIKMVVFDVDGVLTSGHLHYQAQGEAIKVFHVRDGVGLKLLQDMGIHVAVVTAKDSDMVHRRISEMGIAHYVPGCKDKRSAVARLAQELNLELSQCCFVGDDMVDLPAMMDVGVSVCPKDAYPLVSEKADIALTVNGGQGVARLVCDLILNAQGRCEEAYQLTTTETFERKR